MSLVPQVGMIELLVVAMVALIVVGPKDLPRLLYRIGKMAGHVRRMADEFRSSFDQMAREAEIEEMRKEIEALKSADPAKHVRDSLSDVDSAVMKPAKPTAKPGGEGADDAADPSADSKTDAQTG